MIIQVDTREKGNKTIEDYFQQNKIPFFRSALYCGDYWNPHNSSRTYGKVVERKKDIREIATNLTTKKRTFYNELYKLNEIGAEMVILITQDKIDGKKIECLEDVMLWTPKEGQGTVTGMRVYRELSAIVQRFPVRVEFCNKRSAGKRIKEILEDKVGWVD